MKRLWRYLFVVLCIWAVYLFFSLDTPQSESAQNYDISPAGIIALKISILVPFLLCWIFAVTGWVYFRDFVKSLPKNAERRAYNNVARGLLVVIAGLIVPALVNTTYRYFSGTEAGELSTKINNYVNIFLPLIGFSWMFVGTSQLMRNMNLKIATWSKTITVFLPVTLFSIFYIAMIFTNPSRQYSADPSIPASFYISDPLIIVTIILPVIASWIVGLHLALNLEQYSHHVNQKQKPGLANFYNGVLFIVGSVILTQALESVGGERFSSYGLGIILFLIVLLLVTISIGYGLIAKGAKKLSQINTQKTAG